MSDELARRKIGMTVSEETWRRVQWLKFNRAASNNGKVVDRAVSELYSRCGGPVLEVSSSEVRSETVPV